MNEIARDAIGKRLRELRKRKGYNQTELANMLQKSLRTIQKYESGEIEISIAMINEIAKKLDTTATYLLGSKVENRKMECFADVISFLFELEQSGKFAFTIDVKRPPTADGWQCALSFDGKDKTADANADMCLFLEDWNSQRENYENKAQYEQWKEQSIAYYTYANILDEKKE